MQKDEGELKKVIIWISEQDLVRLPAYEGDSFGGTEHKIPAFELTEWNGRNNS